MARANGITGKLLFVCLILTSKKELGSRLGKPVPCTCGVPMYREQLDRPGVSALALQPGIEKKGGCMVR